jgi:hypothetical protein
MTAETLERPARTDNGQGEGKVAHYARDRDKLTDAYVFGTPVIALCGLVWVPSRDPAGLPICKECKEIFERLPE